MPLPMILLCVGIGVKIGSKLHDSYHKDVAKPFSCGDNVDCAGQLEDDINNGKVHGGTMTESYDKAIGTNAFNDDW